MKKWWSKFYSENMSMVWAAVVSVVLSIGVLIAVKDEVTRFTLIMPIFAGFILFSILTTSDEELEDGLDEEEKKEVSGKKKAKKSSKK